MTQGLFQFPIVQWIRTRRRRSAGAEVCCPAEAVWMAGILLLIPAFSHADYQLGLEAYQQGNYERAFSEWQKVAEGRAGEVLPSIRAEADYALGMLYWIGQGVQQDTALAAHWLRQAAGLNHAGAQTKLGYLYGSGLGVPQSDYEAFKWFRMAASLGDPDAQYNLAVLYREGRGVSADGTRALEWFREAASNGDAESALIVTQYEAGLPVTGSARQPDRRPQGPVAVGAGPPPLSEGPRSGREALELPANGGDWIAGREPEHYTIQVVALREKSKLENLIEANPGLAPWAIYQQTLKGRPLWVLIQGDYPDVEQARAAVRNIPKKIQKREELWIRRFVMIQKLLQ